MGMICFKNTVTTQGTPQQLVPPGAQIIMGGVTYPAGSATLRGFQILVQADPGNTASKNIWIGNKSMVVSTRVGCGLALVTGGQPVSLGQYGSLQDLADLWIDTDSAGANGTQNILIIVVG